MQIGYPDGHCELIDAPAIEDWSPFARLMADPEYGQNSPRCTAGSHDSQARLWCLPEKYLSIRSAHLALLVSHRRSPLSELLKTLMKVRLDKSETRSNWIARPLTEKQMEYAEDDVRYSTRLMEKIMGQGRRPRPQAVDHRRDEVL